MLKIIAVLALMIPLATSAYAESEKVYDSETSQAAENPCREGYQWYREERRCERKLPRRLADKAECKLGETREFPQGDGRVIVRRCGFVD